MPTTTSNGTGGGNWNTGASWVGGVVPPTTNDVAIANGDTITKDTAEGTPDCANLIVNGTLAIGANGVKASGTFTGNGTVTITTGRLWTVGGWVFNTCTVRFDVTGTSGDHATITGDGGIYLNDPTTGYHSVKWCDWTHSATHRFFMQNMGHVFEDCTFQGVRFYGGGKAKLTRCTIGSGGNNVMFESQSILRMDGGVIAGTLDFNSIAGAGATNIVETVNTNVTAGTYITHSANQAFDSVRAQGYDQDIGTYRHDTRGGYTLKSTTSKKAGDYGIEVVPSSYCIQGWPVILEIPIPCASGDSIVPAFYLKNVTADLGLAANADRMYAELDPSDEWGLNEKIDFSALSDSYPSTWVQCVFTGGTAGGTAKKGSVMLRIVLQYYQATAVVYIADLEF